MEAHIIQAKILIVEDTPLNMELCRDLLDVAGYLVYEATDAREAIDYTRQEKFDLILMDIQLPGMDGLSATKIIKEYSMNKDTPNLDEPEPNRCNKGKRGNGGKWKKQM